MKLSPRHRLLLGVAMTLAAVAALVVFNRDDRETGKEAVTLETIAVPPVSPGQQRGLRAELRQALGIDPGTPDRQRLDLLQSLSGALSEDECQALLHALLEPRGALVSEGWYSEYVHEICLVMTGQEASQGDFARALATMARETSSPEVVRDYALQHLRQVWERGDTALRPVIEETFRQITLNDPVLAPAAILSLHLLGSPMNTPSVRPAGDVVQAPPSALANREYHFTNGEMEPLVREILGRAPSADGIVARMTALRIVRERSLPAFGTKLRHIAEETANEHAVVRMAAIAAIAGSAGADDRQFLESLDREDPRIDAAIRHALASAP